jgi:aminoglycoside phosphotransferase (APT) family kinase protein
VIYTEPPPTAREPKPAWAGAPTELVGAIERIVGSPILEAQIVWGGFGPSATFVIKTKDGQKYFCKGAHPGQTQDGHNSLKREIEILTAFPELGSFSPKFHGDARAGSWHMFVMDYVEQTRQLPSWTNETFASVIQLLAQFHSQMPSRAPSILSPREGKPSTNLCNPTLGWRSLLITPEQRAAFLTLFADETETASWLDEHIQDLADLETKAPQMGGPQSWIHQDVRSDNILLKPNGDCLMVDWPFLGFGPILIDVAFFLPSVAGEGGGSPESGLAQYEQASGHRFNEADIHIAAATVAGFFASRAGLPEIPGLPRLRWVQRLQLFPSLAWLSKLLRLNSPPRPKSAH